MIGIKIENTWLDLGKVSITFELLSPIFNSIGSFSYPFTLPATTKNKRALGFPNRINVHQPVSATLQAEIYLKGLPWKTGQLVVKTSNRDEIKAYFTVGEGYFYSAIKDTFLNQIDMGGDRNAQDYYDTFGGHWHLMYDKSYPETDFTLFPFSMPSFYEDSAKGEFLNTDYGGKVNYFTHPNQQYNHDHNSFVIFPFFNYVIDRIFSHLNIAVVKNPFLQDTYLKQLVLFNNITERAWHPDDLIYSSMINRFNLREYMPELSVSDLLGHLQNIFQCYAFVNDQNSELSLRFFKDILNSNEHFNLEVPININSISPNTWDGYEMKYDIDGNDELAKDYFKDIATFNYKGELPDLASLPTSGYENLDMYFIEDIHKYYYYQLNYTGSGGSFVAYSSDRLSFFEGNKKMEISIPGVFSRETWEATCGNKGHWQVIDSPWSIADPPEFRLMFWHGLQNNIPFGSPFNKGPGGSVICNYSLEWDGDYGLKNKFYKEVLQFYQSTQEAEFQMRLSIPQIKQLNFSMKYRFASANWLLDKVKITVTNERISPAAITAWKV